MNYLFANLVAVMVMLFLHTGYGYLRFDPGIENLI